MLGVGFNAAHSFKSAWLDGPCTMGMFVLNFSDVQRP